jgi:thiaminase/transcriptional activator TenA
MKSLFERLKAAAPGEWRAYTDHPFVRALSDGSLPQACFRHYLAQDYLFLFHFARAYGLAAYKADELEDIRHAAAGLTAIIDVEISLHVEFSARWGLSETDMAVCEEDAATMAYSRYVLETGLRGDLLDLRVALAPCIVGYAEIGAGLAADPATVMDANPYREWIEMYSSDDYQDVARAEVAGLDGLMERRGGEARFESLAVIFRQATRLEAAFWESGLNPRPCSGGASALPLGKG